MPPARDRATRPQVATAAPGELTPQMLTDLCNLADTLLTPKSINKRQHDRCTFRQIPLRVAVTHPGGGTNTVTAGARDLSARGLSFVFPGFLHVGSHLRFWLRRRLGGEQVVTGNVVWCRHLSRNWHLVGARFETALFPKLFLDPAEWDNLGDQAEVTRPNQLVGVVLLIDDQEIDRALLKHLLNITRLEVIEAADIASARECHRLRPPDLVLVDLSLGQETGEQAVAALRAAGYRGPAVAVAVECPPDRAEQLRAHGILDLIRKPYTRERLLSAIASQLGAGTADSDALHSPLASDPANAELLSGFLNKVRQLTAELDLDAAAQAFDKVRAACLTLRGSGAGFGFPAVTEAAAEAVKALDAGGNVGDATVELQRLRSVCRRLSPQPPRATGSRSA